MPGTYSQESLEAHFAKINDRLARIEDQLAAVSEKVGLTFQTVASVVPPEVVELARAGKQLDAVRRYRELTGANFDEARSVVIGL